MQKKGQVGFDTGKAVILAVMGLGIVAFISIIVLATMKDTSIAANTGSGAAVETMTTITEIAESFAAASAEDCSAAVIEARNSTGLALISASNYTVSGCTIRYNTAQGNPSGFNNSNWQVNFTFTFNQFANIQRNISFAEASFFSNTTVWFGLLAIVVIVLIISIVLIVVSRFGGSSGGQGRAL